MIEVAIAVDEVAGAVRDKGNLPAAREPPRVSRSRASRGDDYPQACVHHPDDCRAARRAPGSGGRPRLAGGQPPSTEESRYYVLVPLARCSVKMGELDAAEDSYAVVAERVRLPDWRFAALENLAHISALRGDREVRGAGLRADEADWCQGATVTVHAQILQYRAMSWQALGEPDQPVPGTSARDYAQSTGSTRSISRRIPRSSSWVTRRSPRTRFTGNPAGP